LNISKALRVPMVLGLSLSLSMDILEMDILATCCNVEGFREDEIHYGAWHLHRLYSHKKIYLNKYNYLFSYFKTHGVFNNLSREPDASKVRYQ